MSVAFVRKTEYKRGSAKADLYRCDCGRFCLLHSWHAKNGNINSCGKCYRIAVGSKLENLTFESIYSERAGSGCIGVFKCDCGNRIKRKLSQIESGNTSSCGNCANKIEISDYHACIYLNYKGNIKKTLIDIKDLWIIDNYPKGWYCVKSGRTFYAMNDDAGKMHRLILNLNDQHIIVDHINGDGLDNRRTNIRIATDEINSKNKPLRRTNKTGVSGVTLCALKSKEVRWSSRISFQKQIIGLGRHKTLFEAACARKSAELKYGYHSNHGRLKNVGE